MIYTENGVTFNNVTAGNLSTSTSPIVCAGTYNISGNNVSFSGEDHLMLNAIDIDWNGAQTGNSSVSSLNTTGDLIRWIKGIETSTGNGGSSNITVEGSGSFILDSQYTSIATINTGTGSGKTIKLKVEKASINQDGIMSHTDYQQIHPSYQLSPIDYSNSSTTVECSIDGKVHFIDSKNQAVSKVKIKDGWTYEEAYRLTEFYIQVPNTVTSVNVVAGSATAAPGNIVRPNIHVSNTGATAQSGQGTYNLIKIVIRYMGDETTSSGLPHPHYLVEYSVVNDNISQMTNI